MLQTRITELRALAESHRGKTKSAELLIECLDEIVKLQRRREKNIGPTLQEVMIYAEEIGLNSGEPEKFFDYHTARGWKMGKTASAPMRDWRAALRLWKRNCAPVNGKPQSDEPPARWTEFVAEKYQSYRGTFKHAPEYMRLEFATWKKEAGRKAADAPNLL